MSGHRSASLAALALVVSALAACGADDDDDAGRAAQTTVTTASPAGTTVTTGQVAPTTTGAVATLDCQTVGFTPNSEDAASSIRATGLPCAEAEAFVRIAGRRTSSGGPPQVDVEGYRCVRVRSVQDPIPQAFYECTSGARRIAFVRT